MAVFGKLQDLSPLFSKTEELEYLFTYIQSLFKEDFLSQIEKLNVGENFKTPLKYEMFAISHCYALKNEKEGFFESHQKYIDFQIVIDGFERYLLGDKERFTLLTPYDSSKDLEVHSPKEKLSDVLLKARELCVLFPYDVHGVGIGKEEEVGKIVKKVIIKVPQKLIKHRF